MHACKTKKNKKIDLLIARRLTFCYEVFGAQCASRIKEYENGGLGLVVMGVRGS